MAKVLLATLSDYPNYVIRSDGEIIGHLITKNPRALKPWIDKDGYRRVHLTNKDGRKGFSVSALVLLAFVKKPSKLHTVNHINGVKTDDRLENLEWSTRQEQIDHAFALGLKTGYEQGKLKPDDVRSIKRALACGETQKALGVLYGVHSTTIGKIKSGVNWSHIKDF